jgi:hypothetical protein
MITPMPAEMKATSASQHSIPLRGFIRVPPCLTDGMVTIEAECTLYVAESIGTCDITLCTDQLHRFVRSVDMHRWLSSTPTRRIAFSSELLALLR